MLPLLVCESTTDALHAEIDRDPAIEDVRAQATRLLSAHRLRAADALQRAAAIVASDDAPATMTVVTLDARMGEAAKVEGFGVVGVG